MQCTVPTRAILIHGRREKFVHGFRVQFPPPDLCCRIQTLGERVDSSDMLMCFLSQNTQTEVCAEHPKSVDKVIGTVSHPLSSRRVISKFIYWRGYVLYSSLKWERWINPSGSHTFLNSAQEKFKHSLPPGGDAALFSLLSRLVVRRQLAASRRSSLAFHFSPHIANRPVLMDQRAVFSSHVPSYVRLTGTYSCCIRKAELSLLVDDPIRPLFSLRRRCSPPHPTPRPMSTGKETFCHRGTAQHLPLHLCGHGFARCCA